jgi:hypothetical protein
MRACHAPPFYALWAGQSQNCLTALSGVACSEGGRPAAVFFPLGYPFPYGPGSAPTRYCANAFFNWTSLPLVNQNDQKPKMTMIVLNLKNNDFLDNLV